MNVLVQINRKSRLYVVFFTYPKQVSSKMWEVRMPSKISFVFGPFGEVQINCVKVLKSQA